MCVNGADGAGFQIAWISFVAVTLAFFADDQNGILELFRENYNVSA